MLTANNLTLPRLSRFGHVTPQHSSEVMRICSPKYRIPILRPWDHRHLRTSPRTVSLKPLNNTELLEFISEDQEDSTSTALAQTNLEYLNPQEGDTHTQRAPLLATSIPRLPRSPLTDQSLVAARTRHTVAKPFPSADRSPFQSKLQKNPFGMRALICGTEY